MPRRTLNGAYHACAGANRDRGGSTPLYRALQWLPDPRRKQGKHYSLARILSLVIVAELAGGRTISGVIEWVRRRSPRLVQWFGLHRVSMSCQTTSSDVLAHVDGQPLDAIVRAYFVRWEAQTRTGSVSSLLAHFNSIVMILLDRVGVRMLPSGSILAPILPGAGSGADRSLFDLLELESPEVR